MEDFVDETEEEQLLQSVEWNDSANDADTIPNSTLKHRQVKHFGYEFLYGTNNVDIEKPLKQDIPAACDMLWDRLREREIAGLNWAKPEQLTVNKYEPGQGKVQCTYIRIFFYLMCCHFFYL